MEEIKENNPPRTPKPPHSQKLPLAPKFTPPSIIRNSGEITESSVSDWLRKLEIIENNVLDIQEELYLGYNRMDHDKITRIISKIGDIYITESKQIVDNKDEKVDKLDKLDKLFTKIENILESSEKMKSKLENLQFDETYDRESELQKVTREAFAVSFSRPVMRKIEDFVPIVKLSTLTLSLIDPIPIPICKYDLQLSNTTSQRDEYLRTLVNPSVVMLTENNILVSGGQLNIDTSPVNIAFHVNIYKGKIEYVSYMGIGRYGHGLVGKLINKCAVAVGGMGSLDVDNILNIVPLKQCEIYKIENNKWKPFPSLNIPRIGPGIIFLDYLLYVFMGAPAPQIHSTYEVFNTKCSSNKWVLITLQHGNIDIPYDLQHMGCQALNGYEIVIWGGISKIREDNKRDERGSYRVRVDLGNVEIVEGGLPLNCYESDAFNGINRFIRGKVYSYGLYGGKGFMFDTTLRVNKWVNL